jgi:hypothetical protein
MEREKIMTEAMNNGKNPTKVELIAEIVGDPGVYQEISVSAFRNGYCVTDLVVGITEAGEVVVMITTGGDGDGDKRITFYPER